MLGSDKEKYVNFDKDQMSHRPPCSSLARLKPFDKPGMLFKDCPPSLPDPLGSSRLPATPGALK